MKKLDILFLDNHISISDMGFVYGFCLFETFLVSKDGNVFLLERHIERMLNSACFFGIDVGIDLDEFKEIVSRYIGENKIANTIIRLTLTAGNIKKGINPSIVFSNRENTYTLGKIKEGCKLHLSEVRKSESSIIIAHKTGNYLENYFLLEDAIINGFDDVLFLNGKSQITETSKCNIFFVKNDTICTPNLSCGLLPGIIRSWIIENVYQHGIKCIEGVFHIEDLLMADEVFVCNSVMGIMHVKGIGEESIGLGNVGEMTKFLQNELFLQMG